MPIDDFSKQRATSAGYRFPISSRPKSSEFHSNCAPKPAAAATQTTKENKNERVIDSVVEDKIWKQSVNNEKNGSRQWKEQWGFIAEFDPKGRPKTPKELPDRVNMFAQSDAVPNTNSGNYGARLQTDLGQAMQAMEFQFNSGNRKRKLGNEMVCY